jgi:aspartate beta-hydroxylase
VLAALVYLANRRGAEAAALAARAQAAFDAWGVAWDKRLSFARWQEIADLVCRDGRKRDAEAEVVGWRAESILAAARGSPERIWALLDDRDAFRIVDPAPPRVTVVRAPEVGPEPLPPRFIEYIGGLRHNADRPLLQFYPGLRAMPWHDPHALPIVADLERLAPEIANEARNFDALEVQDEAEEIRREGRWSVAFLIEMGRRSEPNLDRCPATRSVLEKHQTRITHAGSVYFSRLAPRTKVAPHRGPTNVRVRCHLGLEVPAGCGVRVGGVVRGWEEGRCIVFDDSFTHEAWNDSDRRRTVLILDLWHPDLSEDEIALLSGLHRYGRTSNSSLQQYWTGNEAARERARLEPPALSGGDAEPADASARATTNEMAGGVSLWHSGQYSEAIGLAALGVIDRR